MLNSCPCLGCPCVHLHDHQAKGQIIFTMELAVHLVNRGQGWLMGRRGEGLVAVVGWSQRWEDVLALVGVSIMRE